MLTYWLWSLPCSRRVMISSLSTSKDLPCAKSVEALSRGWRINGSRATDGTRHNILGTPPFKILKFTMKYYEQTRVIDRGVAEI
ncbi:hypothetical protein TNCV_783111 [Trichonephila clavipes]|nr:hypothetical protein TNCV_783111 [Trichonephila clavipes]